MAGDHQTANARAVEAAGGAVLVADVAQIETLPQILPALFADRERVTRMSRAMLAMSTPDAVDDIVSTILAHVSTAA